MKKIFFYIKRNYPQLILIGGIILITAVNLNLRLKLKECSDNKFSNIEKINIPVDSLEGFSLPKNLLISINKINLTKDKNLNVGVLIFTKPEKSCGKCLLSILAIWFKN